MRDRDGDRLAVALLVAFVLCVLLISHYARAHRAPSGFEYEIACCHRNDCAQVPDSMIREAAGGYAVVIPPGGHPMVPADSGGVRAFVRHGDDRIRASGDGRRHACISASGYVLCIYVEPGGV